MTSNFDPPIIGPNGEFALSWLIYDAVWAGDDDDD